MTTFYLTDTKTWIDHWDGKRWEPVSERQTAKFLEAIRDNKIAIHWRNERIAEFVIDSEGNQ